MGAVALALAVAQPADAHEPATRQQVDQKLTFLAKLINESEAGGAIVHANNVQAQELFLQAVRSHQRAKVLVEEGKIGEADKTLNGAILAMAKARSMLPYRSAASLDDERYRDLLPSTETLLDSYARHAQPVGSDAYKQAERTRALVEKAKQLKAEGKTRPALERLAEAQSLMLAGMNQLLGSATLNYTPTFTTPGDEFAFELERYRSLAQLVPVAVRELKPTSDAQTLIVRYTRRSEGMRAEAEGLAARSDYSAALNLIRDATMDLQRALTAAGVVVPPQ
ncbi:MAG TPA: hypothetical protein VLW45_06205 [Pelomicrobium sp.]|nr:hypothetical protein [Pelomicrobium sp.]